MDQSELYGRVIKVNQAKPQKDASEKLGSKTAIWEQVRLLVEFRNFSLLRGVPIADDHLCYRRAILPRTRYRMKIVLQLGVPTRRTNPQTL